MTTPAEIAEYYRTYGDSSFAADQPMYAAICRGLVDYPEVLEMLASHQPEARQPNLLFAAVHYLLLGGLDHPLANVYAGSVQEPALPHFVDVVLGERDSIDELLATRRTQTNEVGRSAVIALMLADAQARSGQTLAWVDLGASGGLNLNLDQFRVNYQVGDTVLSTGPPDATVQLDCHVRHGRPPVLEDHARIGWRLGIDRTPIDVLDPDQARWLHACLWPGQHERQQRLTAAIKVAAAAPPRIVAADAEPGLRHALAQSPVDAALVVTTTWVWYYLPTETRQGVLDVLRSAGRPVWWYSLEGRGVVAELNQPSTAQLSESHVGRIEFDAADMVNDDVLATSHPHAAWLAWGSA